MSAEGGAVNLAVWQGAVLQDMSKPQTELATRHSCLILLKWLEK
jgi:hypothetical protein